MRGLFIGSTLVGVLIGLGLGLAISWVFWPVSYTDADPADLRLDIKDDYVRMIAAAYSLDGDMAQAMQRLAALHLERSSATIARLIRLETDPLAQQALLHLALDLERPAVALSRPTFTPHPSRFRTPVHGTATPKERPTPTTPTARGASAPTPLPLPLTPLLPEPTLSPPIALPNQDAPRFELVTKSALTCAQAVDGAQIVIQVEDTGADPKPGIGVEVHWAAGDEILYTGLKPERGIGYADLAVGPGDYEVRLTDSAQSEWVQDLRIDQAPLQCSADAPQVRGWELVFREIAP